jgi:Leucine-rich repeat (LRR) protein
LYDVKPLNRKHAQELFCRHAFSQAEPIEGYQDLVKEFLKICEGWPLGLKVLGEQLAVKLDRTYWKRQLDMFSHGLPLPEADAAINTLKWSYQAMEIEEKEMLLDVSCFLVGENVELAVRVLEGLGYYNDVGTCLESLRQKCLLDFNNDMESQFNTGNGSRGQDILTPQGRHVILPTVLRGSLKIRMQNQVRELARHIVREDFRSRDKRPLRLSCSTDIVKMLQLHDGSDFCCIRGIRIPGGQDPPPLTSNLNVTGLRLLVVDSVELSSFFGSGISGDLVWLRWRDSLIVPLPSTISVKSLRILELQGPMDDLEKLFIRFDDIPEQLRDLNVDAMEEGTTPSPSSSSQPVDLPHWMDGKISTNVLMPSFYSFLERVGTLMTNLIKIVLKNLTFLELLPIDFSELSNLRHLDLSGSSNLTELPTSFSQLLQLQHLALRDCENLSIPTDLFGQISTLESIDFKGCTQLLELPQGIASQRNLRYLNLLYTHLKALPLNLKLLDKLEQLRIGSGHLTKIPDSVASLKGLKELILFGCDTLDDITPIETLKLLERLEIYNSAVQTTLPSGIVRLKNIKILVIDSCPIVELSFHGRGYLPDDDVMHALRDFTLTHTSISGICIPQFVCPSLEIVDLSYNFQLMQVQVLASTLVRLNLEGCSSLKTLINLSNLPSLKFLNIDGCVILETLNVEGLTSLEEISAAKCWKLQSIEASSKLEWLNFLCVSRDLHGRLFSNALTAPSQTSTVVFSGKAHDDMNIENVMRFILSSFEDLSVLDVPASTSNKSPVWLSNVHSHGAILMFFITYRFSRNGFCVSFEPSNNHAACEEYNTVCGDGSGGSRLHIYMWTEDSKLFKDENFYNEAAVYHDNLYSVGNKKPAICHDNIYYKSDGERGWIVTFATKTQAFDVCKQIMLQIS